MKKLLALVLIFATVAAGCSKPAFRTVDKIKKDGKIVMLTNAAFEPYEYIAGGEVAGVDVDLAQLIADELGVELVIENMNFDLLVEALKSGKGDFIAAGMTATEERAQSVDFSNEYVSNGLLIVVPVGSDIKSPEDLVGKRIAVQETTTADIYVTDNVQDADVMRLKDAVVAGTSVSDGRADACVLDIMPARGVVANSNGTLELLEEKLTDESMSMAVGKGNKELLDVINRILGDARSSGLIDELTDKHMELITQG